MPAKVQGVVSATRLGTGSRITFNQDITHCAYFASVPQNQDSFAYAVQYAEDTATSVTVNTCVLSGGSLNVPDRLCSVGMVC